MCGRLFYRSPPHFEAESLTPPGASSPTRLTGEANPWYLPPLPLSCSPKHVLSSFYMSSGGLNSGLHGYKVSHVRSQPKLLNSSYIDPLNHSTDVFHTRFQISLQTA